MKVPQFRYSSQDFFGDSAWYVFNRKDDAPLSPKNPLVLHVGDTNIPSALGSSFTKIKSPWLWRYGFPSANTGNFWGSSSTGSNGTSAISTLGVGVSDGTVYAVGSGSAVEEGFVTSGTSGDNSVDLATVNFSNYHDWYFSTPATITVPSMAAKRAIAVRFKAAYSADLPAIYTISGNTVTWNTSHPVYILLEGQECTPY